MKTSSYLILLLLSISLHSYTGTIVQAKKSKNPTKVTYPEISSHKRPNDIEPDLYCATCLAMVEVSIKKLGSSRRESDIMEVLEDICTASNYNGWQYKKMKFLAPYLSDTCDEIRAGWEEKLEKLLLSRVWHEQDSEEQHIKKQ